MNRRGAALALAAWVSAVAVTSVVAWVAIDHAGREVLSASGTSADAAGVLSGASGTASVPASTPRPQPARSSAPTTAPTSVPQPRSGGTASSTLSARTTQAPGRRAPTSSSPASHPSSRSSRSHPSSSSSPSSPSSQSTNPKAPASAVDGSVRVDGGQVGARCEGERISLRFAQPSDGWAVRVEEAGPESLHVQFTQRGGQEGESEVEARCSGGAPTFQTSGNDDGEGDERVVGADHDDE